MSGVIQRVDLLFEITASHVLMVLQLPGILYNEI